MSAGACLCRYTPIIRLYRDDAIAVCRIIKNGSVIGTFTIHMPPLLSLTMLINLSFPLSSILCPNLNMKSPGFRNSDKLNINLRKLQFQPQQTILPPVIPGVVIRCLDFQNRLASARNIYKIIDIRQHKRILGMIKHFFNLKDFKASLPLKDLRNQILQQMSHLHGHPVSLVFHCCNIPGRRISGLQFSDCLPQWTSM